MRLERGQPRKTGPTSQLDGSHDTATDHATAAAHESIRYRAAERSLSRDEQNLGRLLAGDALIDYLVFVVELQAERIAELEQRLDYLDRPGGAITELRCAVRVVIGELDGLRPGGAQRKVA